MNEPTHAEDGDDGVSSILRNVDANINIGFAE